MFSTRYRNAAKIFLFTLVAVNHCWLISVLKLNQNPRVYNHRYWEVCKRENPRDWMHESTDQSNPKDNYSNKILNRKKMQVKPYVLNIISLRQYLKKRLNFSSPICTFFYSTINGKCKSTSTSNIGRRKHKQTLKQNKTWKTH